MADKTNHETTLSRSDAAEYLQSLGVGLGDDRESWIVPVGNKTVDVTPGRELTVETTVDERSRMLGDDITEVTIQLSWTDGSESSEGGEAE
ncbi:amphi-Trp domain-containing protein [Halohasta litorea]|uniref:Amphi-Trp domain-containing protein n=1 Tax=Halohasta litorea TaxID=869891 RepID=A0ABD6D7R5_9EURY|nr:amphi-Trp domain-containing protein [Halohasta litorea]